MDVASLFIAPDLLSKGDFGTVRTKKMASSVPLKRSRFSLREEEGSYWMNIRETKSKYAWMPRVHICISQLIPFDMSVSARLHLDDVIEKFVDEKITPLFSDTNVDSESLGFDDLNDDFGVELLASWLNLSIDEVRVDDKLASLSQEIQDCYDMNKETPVKGGGLYLAITSIVVVKFLEEAINGMLDSEINNVYISLFHLLHVEETDIRFSMFKSGHVADRLIPVEPNLDGFTVDKLRLGLAEFIKDNYDQHPFLEEGVLTLLAGSSNIIEMNLQSSVLAYDLCNALGQDYVLGEKELFFILHKYILYLTFENVQVLLQGSENKYWTVNVVIDALNQAAITYRNKIASYRL
jgi:hypothetical protein